MNLDTKVREKLLKESKTPFLGFRRLIWGALLASATVGLLIMLTKALSGGNLILGDIGIQLLAILIFGGLIFFDRNREE